MAQVIWVHDVRQLLGFINNPEGYLRCRRIPPADRTTFWAEHQTYRFSLWQRLNASSSARKPRAHKPAARIDDTDLLEGPEAEEVHDAVIAHAAWLWSQAPRFRQFEREQARARSPDQFGKVSARYKDLPTWDDVTNALRILRRPKGQQVYPDLPPGLSAESAGVLAQLRSTFDGLSRRTVRKCPSQGCGRYFIPGRRRSNQRYCNRCRRRGSRWTRWRAATDRTARPRSRRSRERTAP